MSIFEYQKRNLEMARRYKVGESVRQIARDNGVSYARAMQVIARQIMRGDGNWYSDKLPTMTRNAISNTLFRINSGLSGPDLWTRPEREVAEIVAGIGLSNLRATPNMGTVGLCHIKQWLQSHGLDLK